MENEKINSERKFFREKLFQIWKTEVAHQKCIGLFSITNGHNTTPTASIVVHIDDPMPNPFRISDKVFAASRENTAPPPYKVRKLQKLVKRLKQETVSREATVMSAYPIQAPNAFSAIAGYGFLQCSENSLHLKPIHSSLFSVETLTVSS